MVHTILQNILSILYLHRHVQYPNPLFKKLHLKIASGFDGQMWLAYIYVVMCGWIKSVARHYIKVTYSLQVLYQLPKWSINFLSAISTSCGSELSSEAEAEAGSSPTRPISPGLLAAGFTRCHSVTATPASYLYLSSLLLQNGGDLKTRDQIVVKHWQKFCAFYNDNGFMMT